MPQPPPDLSSTRDAPAHLSTLAVLSVLAGTLSLCPLMAAGAVLLGLWARRSIGLSEGRLRGKWPANIGIGLGVIGAGVTVIAVIEFVPAYREVTPVARAFLTKAGEGPAAYSETYGLCSPEYRLAVPEPSHLEAVYVLMNEGRAGKLESLRWAYRLTPAAGLERVTVTYDARFTNTTRRLTFEFEPTGETWAIHSFSAED